MCRQAASRNASLLKDLPRCEAMKTADPCDNPPDWVHGYMENRGLMPANRFKVHRNAMLDVFGFGLDGFTMASGLSAR